MNTTRHKAVIADSRELTVLGDETVDLVVTSPPYPMIHMWDGLFSTMSPEIKGALEAEHGDAAFELMHQELDKAWKEIFRVAKEGAVVCINVGDATRTIGGKFQLYSNHARIISSFKKIGFDTLPLILWRKQTNAPNKFMGSGMLPGGAYVTLEHEYILIFRKNNKRLFTDTSAKEKRMKSSYFWEERNSWFSDVWDLKGVNQKLGGKELRSRSAAYPFELSYRLINMYSVKNDVVLDPFLGTGTTLFSSVASERNSIGVELDASFRDFIFNNLRKIEKMSVARLHKRYNDHMNFIKEYISKKGPTKYTNSNHGFPVVTKQETNIELNVVNSLHRDQDQIIVRYLPIEEIGIRNEIQLDLFGSSI